MKRATWEEVLEENVKWERWELRPGCSLHFESITGRLLQVSSLALLGHVCPGLREQASHSNWFRERKARQANCPEV